MKYLYALVWVFLTLKSSGQDTLVTIAYIGSALHIFNFAEDSTNYIFIDTTQDGNIWQVGTPQKIVFDSALTGTAVLVTDTSLPYPIQNTSSFQLVVFSDNQTIFEFYHRYDTDSLNDGGTIEVSPNGGLTWLNVVDNPFHYSGHWGFYSTNDSRSSRPASATRRQNRSKATRYCEVMYSG